MITMEKQLNNLDRRNFIKKSAILTSGLITTSGFTTQEAQVVSSGKELFLIGPMDGYSPQIGTLVSMLNYNRQTIINTVKDLTMTDLDHLFDAHANTIGALILHLGATDKFYQINTFEGRQELNDEEKKMWGAARELGDRGRKEIKGHDVKYYLDAIDEVRQQTLAEFKKKDDKWLLEVDPLWSVESPLNTYWKWFHVCEHESNHRGQMTWLKKRLPGAKPEEE
jgi:uncharacterized damage-inducible protein DinB